MFDRISVLRALFPRRDIAAQKARRWRAAASERPELVADVLELAGILAAQPVTLEQGVPEIDTIDPYRLAYEAGRRDLGLQLLAMMQISIPELNSLMEDNHA